MSEGKSVLVIGGGPGGYVAAIRAAQLGAQVTLAEPGPVGGTCLNVGCIPTKALLHGAELANMAGEAKRYGVRAEVSVDFGAMQRRKAAVVRQLVGGVERLLKSNGVEVVPARAAFTGPKTVRLSGADGDSRDVSPDKIIIATGSVPATPPVPGLDGPYAIDSTGALALEEIPASLVVIGGGVIGVEMATIYAGLGCKVTIVEMLPQILPSMDGELAAMSRMALEGRGVEVLCGAAVQKAEAGGPGVLVTVEAGGETRQIEGEKLLVATGRRPFTDGLGLEAAGIATERGAITVDAQMRTGQPDIYAIGDCTGGMMLAHVASAQGEVAAEHAMGHDASYRGDVVPACVYTAPEFAGVGLTEEAAKAAGIEVAVGKFPLMANGKALITGTDGAVKVIAEKAGGRILGVHILGDRATDLITEGALAVTCKLTLKDVIDTIHAHPTIGEAVREAALAAEGRAIHILNR